MGGGNMLAVSCVVDPNPNEQIISLQMCGNGIVENGEDCDPGFNVTSNCCDSATCKFTAGAVCDPASSPCCTAQCSFAPSTQVCRPAKDPRCDYAEMCTGNSSTCPPDHFASNGEYDTCPVPIINLFGQLRRQIMRFWSQLRFGAVYFTLPYVFTIRSKLILILRNGSPMPISWRFHGI